MVKYPKLSSPIVLSAVLTVATVLVYANSINNGFVWDDSSIILNNPANKDMSALTGLFLAPDTTYSDEQTPYYRPLNRLTYMLDYQLYGLNPLGYHMENLILHVVVVLLLFMLVNKLFLNSAVAFIAAFIFALHPINSEAVNFISGGRNTILAAAFALASFIVFTKGTGERKIGYAYLSGLLFFLSLLCKESAAFLPLILLLYGFKSDGSSGKNMKQKLLFGLPFLLFSALYIFMRAQALSNAIGTSLDPGGLWSRISKNFYIIPKYLYMFVYPSGLSIYYPPPGDLFHQNIWPVLGWSVVLPSLFWLSRKNNERAFFGIVWFAINFILIANIVPIPSAPMAERYIYLPVMGLCVIAGELLYRSYLNSKIVLRMSLVATATVLFLTMAFTTARRNSDWRDDLSLFGSVVRSQPDSAFGHYNLGCAFKDRGDLISAKREWERTLDIDPNNSQALNQLGNVYYISDFPVKARDYFIKAVQMNPGNSEAQYNLAITLEKLNEPGEALAHYEMFLKKVPPEYNGVVPEVEKRIDALSHRGNS